VTASSLPAVPNRLPPWRLAAGVLILCAMAVILLSLAPVYLKDYELKGYLGQLAARPNASAWSDQSLQNEVATRAQKLGLPVGPDQITITRTGAKVRLETKYAVHFQFYQVDLHFHSSAASR
jgi:hypothetical protein